MTSPISSRATLLERFSLSGVECRVDRDAEKLRPYLRLANLSNTGYQEINGVAMPSAAPSPAVFRSGWGD
jgi:hypothetical protein